METQKNNPLHNISLQQILTFLIEEKGWEYLASEIKINCFITNPSLKSSLIFLRKTPWARTKVESLYLYTKRKALVNVDNVVLESTNVVAIKKDLQNIN